MPLTPADPHIISSSTTLLEAIRALNALSGGVMTLLAVDGDGRLAGALTDGDVRRALLRGVTLDAPVAQAMNTPCTSLPAAAPDLPRRLRDLRSRGLRLVPLVDADMRPVELVDTAVTPTRLPLGAILMAGGRGQRLFPLTLTTPKPLLPVGGKAIIDHNIAALARCGITRIAVTVNYLAEQLEQHFQGPVEGVQVVTVRETQPLGTIGAASLVDIPADGATIVMNSDLLTRIDFEAMWLHHVEARADITVAAIPYNVSVPYAILTLEGSGTGARVTGLEEKPTYSHYANAGIYIFANDVLRALPSDRPTDAPAAVEQAIAQGRRVTCYPFDEMWIDIGRPADYRHACEIMG